MPSNTYELIQSKGKYAVCQGGRTLVGPWMDDLEEALTWKAHLEEADDEIDNETDYTAEQSAQ